MNNIDDPTPTDIDSLKESLIFYMGEKKSIHMTLKNKRFYNGTITEVRDKIIILNDRMMGLIPIPILDIFLIENFHERTEDKSEVYYDPNGNYKA